MNFEFVGISFTWQIHLQQLITIRYTFMFYNQLNNDSLQRIGNIVKGFRNYPAYAAYSIRSYAYDLRTGAHALEITHNGQLVNLWLFYPGIDGKIASIAVYGNYLQGHLKAILSSMTVFGMKVSSAEIDHSGMSDFIDIYLVDY